MQTVYKLAAASIAFIILTTTATHFAGSKASEAADSLETTFETRLATYEAIK